MKFELNYDQETCKLKSVDLIPEKDENPDNLYEFSKLLKVHTPLHSYCDVLEKGTRGKISDELTEKESALILRISKICFKDERYTNIFNFCAKLMELLMEAAPYLPYDQEECE